LWGRIGGRPRDDEYGAARAHRSVAIEGFNEGGQGKARRARRDRAGEQTQGPQNRRGPTSPPTTVPLLLSPPSHPHHAQPAFRVAGTLTSPAPPATAWAALTDYAAAPSIFASVAACAELGPCPTTPGAVRIEQAVAWSFLVFGGAFKMTLAVADAPPPPDAPPGTRALAFTLVDSRYLSSFRGLWTVAPEAGGGCAVTHELAVTPRAPPPKAVRKLVQSLFARQVAALLADLEAELERRGAAV